MESDHDLLIRIDEKLAQSISHWSAYSIQNDKEKVDIWKAIDALRVELGAMRQLMAEAKGMAIGIRALWALVGSLPPGAIALVLGLKEL